MVGYPLFSYTTHNPQEVIDLKKENDDLLNELKVLRNVQLEFTINKAAYKVAHAIEDVFVGHYAGGKGLLLDKIQLLIRDEMHRLLLSTKGTT